MKKTESPVGGCAGQDTGQKENYTIKIPQCSTTDINNQESSKKGKKKALTDLTEWWKGLPIGNIHKTQIHAFLVDKKGIDPNVVDKHIANGNLKYMKIKGSSSVLAVYKDESRLAAVQRLTMKDKGFIKGSEVYADGFFIAGCEAKNTDTIMIHKSPISALSGECLYPDICHVAIGSTTLTDKVSKLKSVNKKILVAQANEPAGKTMLIDIFNIHGSGIMGIKWSDTAKAKMNMNDILMIEKKPEIDKVFALAWSIINGGLVGGFSLSKIKFAPMKWAIKGIVAEGVNLLSGKPKCGKSLLCMNLAISVATGEKAFGSIDVEQGSVIYLALEDVKRRLKGRLIQTAGGTTPVHENIQFATEWSKMSEGGIKKLAIALERRPNTRLVIIDTLKMFRPAESTSKSFYNADYEPIARIKNEIADKFNVPVLIIHHLRKSEADDIFDTMSGSTGLTGATDTNIIFEKGSDDSSATLHVQGRDIESNSYAIKLDSETITWKLLGDAKDVKSTDNKQKLYDAIKKADKPLSPKELGKITGIADGYIRKILPDLMEEGGIKKQGRGKYIYSGDPEEPINDNL